MSSIFSPWASTITAMSRNTWCSSSMLLSPTASHTHATVHRRKDEESPHGRRFPWGGFDGEESDGLSVCVTSGISYLGWAIVNRLLLRGYSVRVMVDNEEDLEKLREMETAWEMGSALHNFRAAVAKLSDINNLTAAFEGCRGVFHMVAFADPASPASLSLL